MYYAGIDLGSITAKAVIIANRQILASTIAFSGYNSTETAGKVLAEALEEAGLRRNDVARLVATGSPSACTSSKAVSSVYDARPSAIGCVRLK